MQAKFLRTRIIYIELLGFTDFDNASGVNGVSNASDNNNNNAPWICPEKKMKAVPIPVISIQSNIVNKQLMKGLNTKIIVTSL